MRSPLPSLLSLCLLAGAVGCLGQPGFGVGVGTSPPLQPEVRADKRLTVRLDASHRQRRFAVPVSVEPAPFNSQSRLDLVVTRAARPLRVELANNGFDSADAASWIPLRSGEILTVFGGGGSTDRFVVSLGLEPDDSGEPLDVDVLMTWSANDDDDFNGVSDGVFVAFQDVEPLP